MPDSPNDVALLQQALTNLAQHTFRGDVNPGPITGVMNDQTAMAVGDAFDLIANKLASWLHLSLSTTLMFGVTSDAAEKFIGDNAAALAIAVDATTVALGGPGLNIPLQPAIPWYTTTVGVIALGVVGFFVYRKFFAKRSSSLAGSEVFDVNRFRDLLRDPDPNSLTIAEDYVLEHEQKLSKLAEDARQGAGHWTFNDPDSGMFSLGPLNPADAPVTRVNWTVSRIVRSGTKPLVRGPDTDEDNFETAFEIMYRNERVMVREKYNKTSRETARRLATARAWHIAKNLKLALARDADYQPWMLKNGMFSRIVTPRRLLKQQPNLYGV